MKHKDCDSSRTVARAGCIVLVFVASWLSTGSPAMGAPSGAVVAWGDNTYGQTNVPIEARSGVLAVAAGNFHSMALKDNGSVVAWGDSRWGQTNVPVEARSGVMAIAAGDLHSVAVKDDGTVVAWGDNTWGQTRVPAGLSDVKTIAAGTYHTLALKNNGSVVAWGYGVIFGQTNVPIAARSGVVAIAAGGNNSLALKGDGSVVAWGDDNWSQTAVPANAQSGVTAIAAGGIHTVVLKSDGSVMGWGSQSWIPFAARLGVKAISAASFNETAYGLALKTNGLVVAWGLNPYGATVVPPGMDEVIMVAAGRRHALAITLPGVPVVPTVGITITKPPADGSVGVGHNAFFNVEAEGYALGYQWQRDGVAIAGATNATLLWPPATLANDGAAFTVVVSNAGGSATSSPPAVLSVKPRLSGAVVAWGLNDYGQTNIPFDAQSIVMAVDAGRSHAVALTTNGTTVAWGDNTYGQANVPATARSGVMGVAAGWYHSVALKSDGSVVEWGLIWQPTVPVEARSGVVAVAAGGFHTAALKSDGRVVVWGDNVHGQTDVPRAAQSGVVAIAAGGYLTAALKNDGSVVAWGRSSPGALLPSVPYDALSGVVAIAAGDDAVIALKNDGTSVEWSGVGLSYKPMEARNGLKAVSAGFGFLALKTNGSVLVWGGNQPVPPSLEDVIAISSGYRYWLAVVLTTNLPPGLVTTPPVITKPPADQPVYVGQNAAFTVEAQGSYLRYQWQRNGVAIAGATNSSCFITLPVTQTNDGDAFTVVVSNPAGVVTSSPPATISVKARPSGAVVAWGNNNFGQTNVPAEAQGGVVAVAAGGLHTLALKTNGTLVGWGQNSQSQSSTVFFGPDTVVTAIAAGGNYSMALMNDGSVVAWGDGRSGVTEVPVSAQSGVIAIAAGGSHALALKSDGSVVAWGFGFYGQTTVPVAAQSGVVSIAAGGNYTVALKSDGSVVAWGVLSLLSQEPLGVLLRPDDPAVAIAAGSGHIVALKADGSLAVWGNQSPIPVAAHNGVKAISAGSDYTVALKTNGALVAWGLNTYGQSTVPASLDDATAIAAGGGHTVAIVIPSVLVAHGQSVTAIECDATSITLTGSASDGATLTYAIETPPQHGTLSGTPPNIAYTPAPRFTGLDTFSFTISNGRRRSLPANVVITVRKSRKVITAAIAADQLVALHPDFEHPVLISCNWWNSCLTLDGSGSTSQDACGKTSALSYWWFVEPEPVPFAFGAFVTNCLEVGTHTIILTVIDAEGSSEMDTMTIEVVTAPLAIDLLIEQVNESGKAGITLSRKTKRELTATLQVALGHAGREQLRETQKALDAFEKKVRAQVAKGFPAAATAWIRWSQAVSEGMENCIKPSRKPKPDDDATK